MRQIGLCTFILAGIIFGFERTAQAQSIGGRSKLDFLQLPAQAKSNALGTHHVTISGNDPALFIQNPALLDSSKANNVSINLMPYLADTRFVNAAYARRVGKSAGVWAVGLQYLNYGTMVETDDIGNVIGEFRAADYGLSAGYGHSIGAFTVGGTLKMVGASVQSYNVFGLALDWGGVFKHPEQDLAIGFAVKNMGFVKQNYSGLSDPALPLDVRLGITFKPEYMPIRVSLTAHHLNKFDMVYNDPNLFFTYDDNGNKVPKKVGIAEKLSRHLSLGAEALLHPNFRVMLGYDHLRRQELRLSDRGALAGFSFGAWMRIKRFEVGYGRSQYVTGFGSSSLSIVMNMKNGFAKETVKVRP
ncbi:type IX secretion system protein PorQ [Dyadobacter sp. LJ419]|uniref:Type IX secretion system protein PorQ n=1 Tax=Dyadobacter chenwenxiniae TaxID=2906456 RepID=A0A9X1PNR2_9BACT|nr:type IX secretion system protein PorQ [Dyadobacter chenwenxiniae]MCF0064141.1 type IX secretion system protein PorQ [Dyadobacter chenwenxiniae]